MRKWKPEGKGMERCHFKMRSMIFVHTTYNLHSDACSYSSYIKTCSEFEEGKDKESHI